MSTPVPFSEGLAAGLAGYGERPFIEFERTWYTGDDVAHYRGLIARALADAGVNVHGHLFLGRWSDRATFAFVVDDPEKARPILEQN